MVDTLDPDDYFRIFLADGPNRAAPAPAGPVREWRSWWCAAAFSDPLAAAAAEQGLVMSTAQLAALDVSRSRARWATRTGRWTAVTRGVTAPVDIRRELPEYGSQAVAARRRHALAAAAAILRRPQGAAAGRSAAIVHGLPTFTIPPAPEVVTRDAVGMGRRASAHLFAATLDGWQATTWYGVIVSDVARTLVDLGRVDRRDAIMAADAALRERAVSPDEITRALRLAMGWPGVRQAREVLALADPRAESPLESLVRLALHDDGFPPPDLQFWIGRDRVDFYWPRHRLVLEADGRVKYTGDERWEEKKREQRLRAHRNRVERVTWDDVTRDWPRTRDMLREAFR